MKIGNINVRVTRFVGNLYAVTIPMPETVKVEQILEFNNVRTFLSNISGCAKYGNGFLGPLSPAEISRLPEGITFVLTGDSYTHTLPTYNENVRYALVCTE